MNELEGAQAICDAARDYQDAKPSDMGRIVRAVNTCDEREELIRELVVELEAAHECIIDWSGYAGKYFKEKHNLQDDLDRIENALAKAKGVLK